MIIFGYDELEQLMDDIGWLKSISFRNIVEATTFINKEGGDVYYTDEEGGYIDFNYGGLSCSLYKKEDGYFRLGSSAEIYQNGEVVFRVDFD